MNWLINLIKNSPFAALILPSGLNLVTFLGNLYVYLSDGQLDNEEFHKLMSSASGIEALLIIFIMFALKNRRSM